MDLCNAKTFHEQIQWAFRIFDCDNSKSIGIDEFGDSVKQVWQIFEGVGETKHNPGDCDKTAAMLVAKCREHNMSEVVEPEFVR